MDLFSFQEQWECLVGRAFQNGYETLTPQEKVWFNVQALSQAIDDGGLISYYYNPLLAPIQETLDALETLGESVMADLLRRVNSLFPCGVPTDIDARNEVIDSWPDDGSVDEILDQLDSQASPGAGPLEERLVSYIVEHGLGT